MTDPSAYDRREAERKAKDAAWLARTQEAHDERRELLRSEYANTVDAAAVDMDRFLSAPASQFLPYPWPDLDRIVGGMLKGELHYVCAFSGNGKTLFMLSLLIEWLAAGKRVFFMGLETIPRYLLVNLCAMRTGVSAPEVLTGRLWQQPQWPEIKANLRRAAGWFQDRELYLSPVEHVGPREIAAAYEHAARIGADVLMLDHVDHISGESGRLYEESVAVNTQIERLTKEYQILTVASSQLNLEAVKGDPLAQFRPPRPEQVKMGNKKRELGTTMIGLYRPIRSDVSKDDLKAVKDGAKDAFTILTPWQMGVSVMKNRKGGNDGARCVLSTENYRVQHLPERDRLNPSEYR